MKFDAAKTGAGMLAAGPLLMNVVGGSKWAWWLGIAFTVFGPVMMGFKCGRKKE